MLGVMTTFNQPPRWNEQTSQTTSHTTWTGPTYSGALQTSTTARTNEERLMATVAHLSAGLAWLLSAGWLTFLGPLIMWFVYRDRSPFVRTAAAGSFNFALAMALTSLAGWVMVFTVLLAPLGALLIAASGILAVVLGCIGAVRTWRGSNYRYPWQLRVLS